MVNVEVLRKELEFITGNQEKWNQEIWAGATNECGTTACLAGWTVIHAGYEPDYFRYSEGLYNAETVNHCSISISDAARKKLDISLVEGDSLFYAKNTLRTLWEVANSITNGEIEIPIEFQE